MLRWILTTFVCALSCYIQNKLNAGEWMLAEAPGLREWKCVAISADGQTLMAGSAFENPGFYISTDGGATWRSNVTHGISAVACSADGTRIIASASSGVLISTNSGTTWTNRLGPQYLDVASSSDGSKLLAVNPYRITVSTNYGLTWITNVAPSPSNWWSVATSADGTKSVVASYGGSIVRSTNYGINWMATDAPIAYWRDVISSSDGRKLAAVGWNSSPSNHTLICISTNSGANWRNVNVPNYNWWSIASSGDGRRLLAGFQFGGATGHFYISADSGNTWNWLNMPTNASRAWDYPVVAASTDGQQFVAAFSSLDNDAPVYTYKWSLPVAPVLNVGITNLFFTQDRKQVPFRGVVLRWPSWGTDFVLHGTAELEGNSWIPVTNQPALIVKQPTQESFFQVVLPATNDRAFYKLQIP